MSAAVGTLLRRGVELGVAQMQKEPNDDYQVPAWGILIMAATVLFFVATYVMV